MEYEDNLFTEEGYLNGEVVRACRERLGLTLQDLADRTGLYSETIRKVEIQSPRQRKRHTIAEIKRALGFDKNDIATLGKYLTRRWWGYHWSRNESGSLVLCESEWDVYETGKCKVVHTSSTLTYRGQLNIEAGERVVFTFDIHSDTSRQERVVCRFPLPLTDTNILYGAWFGVDHLTQLCAAPALLSTHRLPETEAYNALNQSTNFMARPRVTSDSDIHEIGKWDSTKVIDAIQNCTRPTPIAAMSTFFPEGTELEFALRTLANNLNHYIPVRILLIDYSNTDLLESRTRLRLESMQYFKDRVIEQSKLFLQLNKNKNINISVRLYDAWPFAHLFRIGGLMYYGLILASESAVNGPMFYLDKSASRHWALMQHNFDKVWKNAKNAEKVLRATGHM